MSLKTNEETYVNIKKKKKKNSLKKSIIKYLLMTIYYNTLKLIDYIYFCKIKKMQHNDILGDHSS